MHAVQASESMGMGEAIEGADDAGKRAYLISFNLPYLAAFLLRLAALIAAILLFRIIKPKIIGKLVTI